MQEEDSMKTGVSVMNSFLNTKRAGSRPRTTVTNPHTQLDQNAPKDLQEKVALGRALSGVAVGPSLFSERGTRAFHLPAGEKTELGAFMVAREFAHHPSAR
jgi:hypothetical protein